MPWFSWYRTSTNGISLKTASSSYYKKVGLTACFISHTSLILSLDLYNESDITSSIIQTVFEQLESANSATQKQALQKLTKLSEYGSSHSYTTPIWILRASSRLCADMFKGAAKANGAILKVIGKLKNSNEDVRSAANAALLVFSAHGGSLDSEHI